MKKKIISSVSVLAILISSPVFADKITDQIKAVEKAYAEKDYRAALDELGYAQAQLQKLKSIEDQKLLPEALSGWEKKIKKQKGNASMMALMGGGAATSISADYTRDKERVSVEIVANSPILSMLGMSINNPAMLANQEDTEPFRYKRNKGMKKVKGDTVEITLLVAGQIAVMLKGRKLKDNAVIEQYLEKIDFAKLKEALL